jgi:hypothetical protein
MLAVSLLLAVVNGPRCKLARSYGVLSLIYVPTEANIPLPSTLDTSKSDGGPAKITFERVIVYPDGRRHIEGVTPKALPAPDGSSKGSSE